MNTTALRENMQAFDDCLEQWQHQLKEGFPDNYPAQGIALSLPKFKDWAKCLQQTFSQYLNQVEGLSTLSPTMISCHTEVNRTLRLLTMDVTFLQSARNTETQRTRWLSIEQRLKQLRGFGQVLLTELSNKATSKYSE